MRVKNIAEMRLKKCCFGANEKNFMDKELNQPIMVRSKFLDTFLKFKSKENSIGILLNNTAKKVTLLT